MTGRCVEKFPGFYYNEQQSRYWKSGDKKFYNVYQALDNTNNPNGISFHMHDNEFIQTTRKQYDLKYLLKQRALQLRNNFDYIRIWYSGGKDSLTIIDSFLEAGCKIDEIATIFTSPAENDFSISDIEYTVAEADLKKRGLSRKIYKSNCSVYEKMYADTDNFFYRVSHGEIFLRTSRPNAIYTLWPETMKQYKQGMRVAEVTGDQTPYLIKKDGHVWFAFIDTQIMHLGAANFEDFFTSSDMPELHIAQAQGVEKYLNSVVTNEKEWNKLAHIQKMPTKDSSIARSKSYGRSIPEHDILISNVFGKTIQHLEYGNYKNQCAAGELNSTEQGKNILQNYHRQVDYLHSRYNFDKLSFPVGTYSMLHSLHTNHTANVSEIINDR